MCVCVYVFVCVDVYEEEEALWGTHPHIYI